jgi:hypothetical protein
MAGEIRSGEIRSRLLDDGSGRRNAGHRRIGSVGRRRTHASCKDADSNA